MRFLTLLLGTAVLMSGLACPLPAEPLVLHVDASTGDDRNPGTQAAPLKTLARALAQAGPGETVRLAPGQPPIHEAVVLEGRSGEPGRPITLDGGGNVLDGGRPLVAAEWEEVRPGLYRNARFGASFLRGASAESTLRRFYFRFGETVQRMGRAAKGANAPLPTAEALQPGEWTYVKAENAFYLAIDPGIALAEAGISHPSLLNGVATRGECRHWVIRNLTVRNFLNDGFNIHGETRDFRLENIAAFDCGDDGLSAHAECELEVEGFTARGCTTGICHIGRSKGKHRALKLEGNVTYNLCLLGSGSHTITDSHLSARDGTLRFGSRNEAGLKVRLERVEIFWPDAGPSPIPVAAGVELSTAEMPPLPTVSF